MSFSYPIAFLILIFIPVLIILYILKNKFTEQTVSSTYLWTLSERFLKRRRPISRIYGILSLILQCLLVAVIALAVAHPQIKLPNQARDYCFIIDSSGSMQIKNGAETRYNLAKAEIKKIIDSSTLGSTYTLISCAEEPTVIYDTITSKDSAISQLDALTITSLDSRCVDAMPLAQNYYDENRSMQVYVASDKAYATSNLNLIDVSNNSANFSFSDIVYNISLRKITLTGNIKSFNASGDVNIELNVDGNNIAETTVSTSLNEDTSFNFNDVDLNILNEDYQSIELILEGNDDLAADNNYIIYNLVQERVNKVLIVSNNPLFLENLLEAFGTLDITVIDEEEYADYKDNYYGYGLYIFDSYNPNELPGDGSVWFMNIDDGIMSDYGFSYQETLDYGDVGVQAELNNRTNSLLNQLKANLTGDTFYVTKYQKYGLYNNFTTLLSCEGNPVLFVGNTPNGNREVVFAFDIHNSNLPLSMDFIILVNNLINYSFPNVLDKTNYVAGDTLSVNVLAGCSSIEIITPSGISNYLDTSSAISDYVLAEAGSYQINVTIDGRVTKFMVYASYPESESQVVETPEIATLSLTGDPEAHYGDGIYQSLVYLFIALGVIFILDWMVYCYEQYKLR